MAVMIKRTSYIKIWNDLATDKDMIFLVGPRQAGKTTLTEIISASFTNHLYFNWDIAEHRTNFLQNPSFFEALERKDSSIPLIVLDEIHKYRDWKNYLKGIYDQHHNKYRFLISGGFLSQEAGGWISISKEGIH
jgi:predicted AAA+ superfamily ATPase